MPRVLSLLLGVLALLAVLSVSPRTSFADALPDLVLEAAKTKEVLLEFANGLELRGVLLAFDESNIAVQKADGTLVSVDRSEVLRIALQKSGERSRPGASRDADSRPSSSAPKPSISRNWNADELSAEKLMDEEAFTAWIESSPLSDPGRVEAMRLRRKWNSQNRAAAGFGVVTATGLLGAGLFGLLGLGFHATDPLNESEVDEIFGAIGLWCLVPSGIGGIGIAIHEGFRNRHYNDLESLIQVTQVGVSVGPSGGSFNIAMRF